MELSPGKLWGLRRLADAGGRFKMLAVDQRPPIKNLVAERRGLDVASYDDVCAVKAMLVGAREVRDATPPRLPTISPGETAC